MATVSEAGRARPAKPWTPDGFERFLAAGSVVLLACVLAAIARGHDRWGEAGAAVWLHLGTIVVALALTPLMLLRPRGDRLHRRFGRVWVAAMLATAALSFLVRNVNHGGLSFIHILSAWTLVQVPVILFSARSHNVVRHRRAVRGMVFGALLIAGFFTFPFNRMLGSWLFG